MKARIRETYLYAKIKARIANKATETEGHDTFFFIFLNEVQSVETCVSTFSFHMSKTVCFWCLNPNLWCFLHL